MSLVFPHTFVPWFRTVAPHIHAYRGKTFVVAIAGELIAAGKLNSFAQDLAILQAMGSPTEADPAEFMAAARRYAIASYDPTGLSRILPRN